MTVFLLAGFLTALVLMLLASCANRYESTDNETEEVDRDSVRVQIPDSLVRLLPPDDSD